MLLRHAKTEPLGSGAEDHERQLTTRGREDCDAIGKYMARLKYAPELMLASTSSRTAETVERFVVNLPKTPQTELLDSLYLAEAREMLAVVRGVPDKVKTLMLVGHNPGMEELATSLAREPVKRKERSRIDLIEEKFPTCARAVLDFSVPRWREIAAGQGELIDFVRPRDL